MVPHYYSQKPATSGKKTVIRTTQFGNHLVFNSQSGIFSWQEVDKGSEILLQNVQLPSQGLILDFGCGYGLIGITLAKANPHLQFILTDINELAARLTKKNCIQNKVKDNTRVFQGNLFEPIPEKSFDLIITNPPLMAGKVILKKIIEQSKDHLTENGSIQLVVPKKKGLISMQKMLEEVFSSYELVIKKSGFWVLKAN
ncbi:MAG: class I SAM-dependent methyltransferase [Asgard group archaeon]|nr:class I SAM-dependent methyltransferase [Asgard group archaeon]